jgi:hypothetical protein
MLQKILSSPILYWTVSGLATLGILMFLTLLISLFVKENGQIVIDRSSLFYKIRFLTMIPWSSFTAFMQTEMISSDRIYTKHPTRDWGQRHHCSYIKRLIIDAHFSASRETSLCGLFWSHLISMTVLLPFNLAAILISLPFVIVAGILAAIGFLVYSVAKIVKVHALAIVEAIIDYSERVRQEQIDKAKIRLDQISSQKVSVSSFNFRKEFGKDIHGPKSAKHEEDSVKEFYESLNKGLVPNLISSHSVRAIVANVYKRSDQAVRTVLDSALYTKVGSKIDPKYVDIVKGLFLNTEFSSKALETLSKIRRKYELRSIKSEMKEKKRELKAQRRAEKRKIRKERWEAFKSVWNKTMCPTIKFVDTKVSLEKK